NGTGNTFVDNLFVAGNTTNFLSGGTGNRVVAYKAALNVPGQDYFYPPLIDNQHTNTTIINGMGRTDLTISSTNVDAVQIQYNTVRLANPTNVIVLHLNGAFTNSTSSLTIYSNTCVLLNGTIQATNATTVVRASGGGKHISISGGIIDGGNFTGHNGIRGSTNSMIQIDAVTVRNFGPANPRSGGSDVIYFDHGSTPYIVTRCTVNGGSSRGMWLQLSGVKSVISDNE